MRPLDTQPSHGPAAYHHSMWLRQLMYRWLFPAAFVLPLWLLIGWAAFNASGWALLWVLLLATPSVFVGQLVFALLVRARPSARAARAVSWRDVAGFGLWHALTIALGFYPQAWFGLLLSAAILVAIGMVWLLLGQLWSEARGSSILTMPTPPPAASDTPSFPDRPADHGRIIVVEESPATDPRAPGR